MPDPVEPAEPEPEPKPVEPKVEPELELEPVEPVEPEVEPEPELVEPVEPKVEPEPVPKVSPRHIWTWTKNERTLEIYGTIEWVRGLSGGTLVSDLPIAIAYSLVRYGNDER